jgi:two-component system sensor histidine kinase KdpD
VADLVSVALRRVEKELAKHVVTAGIPHGLPLVQMDFVLMEQVLVNLLLNAALHTPPGTRVQLNARVEGQEVLLSVADSGPGIAAEAMPHIFDKFYRAPNALAGGSGLGLSIVKGFVEAHGRRVEAQNRPAGGAEFIVRLPLGEAPPPPSESKV